MSTVRSFFLLLLTIFILVFVGVNWTEMNQPTTLSLIFTEVHAPLGLVLLGLMVLLAILFVAVLGYQQALTLKETRRFNKELAEQRELADRAEASRLSDLRTYLDQEVQRLNDKMGGQSQEVLSRIDRAEMGLRERPIDAEIGHLAKAVEAFNRDLQSRVDRLEIGLRERPIESNIHRLTDVVESHNRDLHARVDRLEMGLREGLAGYIPAAPSLRPAEGESGGHARLPPDTVGDN